MCNDCCNETFVYDVDELLKLSFDDYNELNTLKLLRFIKNVCDNGNLKNIIDMTEQLKLRAEKYINEGNIHKIINHLKNKESVEKLLLFYLSR